MTHPFNGSSPSAPTEHLLFINHNHGLLSTAGFSALLLDSVVRTLNQKQELNEQLVAACPLYWHWKVKNDLSSVNLNQPELLDHRWLANSHTAAGRSNRSKHRAATPAYWLKNVLVQLNGLFTDQLLDQEHWWVVSNVRFQNMSAHPEAQYDNVSKHRFWN